MFFNFWGLISPSDNPSRSDDSPSSIVVARERCVISPQIIVTDPRAINLMNIWYAGPFWTWMEQCNNQLSDALVDGARKILFSISCLPKLWSSSETGFELASFGVVLVEASAYKGAFSVGFGASIVATGVSSVVRSESEPQMQPLYTH